MAISLGLAKFTTPPRSSPSVCKLGVNRLALFLMSVTPGLDGVPAGPRSTPPKLVPPAHALPVRSGNRTSATVVTRFGLLLVTVSGRLLKQSTARQTAPSLQSEVRLAPAPT